MPKLDARKVSIFYRYKTAGFSETLYNTRSLDDTKSEVTKYLEKRLAFADDDMEAVYARISDMNNPRSTDFLDLKDTPGMVGKIAEDGCSPDDVILLKSASSGGRSSHFFIHCFPAKFLKQDVVVPNGKWFDLLAAWADYMGSLTAGWGFLAALNPGVASRVSISGAAPQSPRGFWITVEDIAGYTVGQTITVGGASKDSFGYQGRKQILRINVAEKKFLVGGAKPVGTIGDSAFFNVLTYSIAHMNKIRPVKLTERKAGRPFGLPVGRRQATLSLRR